MSEIGTVKFWSEKGYGFIAQDNGPDIFVHHSVIAGDGYKSLEIGQDVEYEYEIGPKGLQAISVIKI